MAKLIQGDLLNLPDVQYIVHQCNCVTRQAKGLARDIFIKFPHANIYNRPRQLGALYISKPVINLVGQYRPGGPKQNETRIQREQWFQQGLLKIQDIADLQSIAFPYNIGCGLAGGTWDNYKKMIDQFAYDNPHVKVYIVNKTTNN